MLTLHSTYLDAEKVLYCTGSKHMRRRSRRSMSLNAHSARHAAPEHSGYHSDSESLDGPRTPVMANPNRGKNKKRATTSDDPRGGAGSPSDELRLNESVIPVVQNKRTMVIVGAVQRADVQQAVLAMRNLADVASMQPVSEWALFCPTQAHKLHFNPSGQALQGVILWQQCRHAGPTPPFMHDIASVPRVCRFWR